mmetsp:Transcript_21465/g.53063  ORF Transcript_21465/g.53063 Transcript_21465/m.53063 type:complete len:244 (-) Transcript_21465:4225-4956(-)
MSAPARSIAPPRVAPNPRRLGLGTDARGVSSICSSTTSTSRPLSSTAVVVVNVLVVTVLTNSSEDWAVFEDCTYPAAVGRTARTPATDPPSLDAAVEREDSSSARERCACRTPWSPPRNAAAEIISPSESESSAGAGGALAASACSSWRRRRSISSSRFATRLVISARRAVASSRSPASDRRTVDTSVSRRMVSTLVLVNCSARKRPAFASASAAVARDAARFFLASSRSRRTCSASARMADS